MKKIIPFFIMICCLLAVSSCSYDNFEEPKATLTGRAIYDGEAVGVRSGSSEFALFQDGYALHGSIPVYVWLGIFVVSYVVKLVVPGYVI